MMCTKLETVVFSDDEVMADHGFTIRENLCARPVR